MKLAKKMLASVMALALVAVLALTAFAAPALSVTATDAVVGETVKITLAATDMVGLQSADLELAYDADALEYVGVSYPDGAKFTPAAGNPSAGLATISLMYLESAEADSAFCTFEFKVLKTGDTAVTVKATSWDPEATLEEATLTIKAHDPVVVETTTAAPETPTEPASADVPTTKPNITQTGEAGIAAIAGVMALAAVAFVATRKKDEE